MKFIMNPEKNFKRRETLTKLLEKTPFQFQFISINDDIELTSDAIAKNHDSTKRSRSFMSVASAMDLPDVKNNCLTKSL